MASYSDVEIRLRNKVCKAYLGCRIDLDALRLRIPHKYGLRENFPGLVYKGGVSPASSGTILVFPNGSIIITGVDNDQTVRRIVEDVARDLKSLGYTPREDVDFKVVNSTAQFRIRRQVDIESFSRLVSGAKLDSSRFQAVTWRDPETGCTVRLFRNGAGVVLGSGDQSKLKASVHNLYKLILKLRLFREKDSLGSKIPNGFGGDGLEKVDVGAVEGEIDKIVLFELLVKVLGPSISKTVMRNLETLKGERTSYSLKDLGEVLASMLGEEPTIALLKRLREQRQKLA